MSSLHMPRISSSARLTLFSCLVLFVFVAIGSSCSPSPVPEATPSASEPSPIQTPAPEPEINAELYERLTKETWTGDINGMIERRYIRALVLYNKTNFFYDGPQARGLTYDSLKEFEKFLNAKLNTGETPVSIVFIPVTREEGIKRMSDGRADLAASNIPIIPEFEEVMDFSDPVRADVKEIVVTGPAAPTITTLEDLAGKEVFVRKHSRYWPNVERLNAKFVQEGKPPISLIEADPNLEDEDILNMVDTGAVGITVMDQLIAQFWAKVHDGLKVHDDVELAGGDRIGWGVQKNTPEFVKLINEFVASHKVGTSFGNVILQRYLKDTKWAKNNAAPAEMEKIKPAVGYFKKYAAQYDFDWLMIAAQAYQESGIDQSKRSPAGAVGVMQIKPTTAQGAPIGITEVDTDMEKNINAGVKYLDYIFKQHFKDAKMNPTNRCLFAFASYNAGPARVAALRKEAEARGLDPNIWFNNVELIAGRRIGAETVTYVSNVYKYYVAYKLVADQNKPKNKS